MVENITRHPSEKSFLNPTCTQVRYDRKLAVCALSGMGVTHGLPLFRGACKACYRRPSYLECFAWNCTLGIEHCVYINEGEPL
jgi:hypothetical protein